MRVLDDNHRLDMVGGSVAIFVKLQHFYRDLRYRHCVNDMSDSSVRHLSSCCCCRCSLHLCSHWSHGDLNVTSSSSSSSCSCCSSWRSRDLEVTPCHCYKLSSSCSARSSSQHCTTSTTTNRYEDRSLTRRSVRSSSLYSHVTSRPVLLLVLLLCWLLHSAACCSSRAKPRVSVSSEMELDRRRMPAHMYDTKPCPEMYEKNFCLNGGTCFCVYIGRSPVFSCVCDDGFMGRRCEFKYLDGHYAKPEQQQQQQQQQHVEKSEEQEREGESLETAGVTAAGAVILITALCLLAIINVLSTRRRTRNNKHCRSHSSTCRCVVNEQQQQQQQQQQEEMVRFHCNHDHDHITDTAQTHCVQCCIVSATSLQQQQQSCIINNVQV